MYLKHILLVLVTFVFGNLSLHAQKTGVMIMAHGGSQQWNDLVTQAAQPLAKKYPVSIAWGMGDPNTLQQSVDELEGKGVTEIVAIPLFISSYSIVIRQTEYLLGIRKELVDAPMPPMNHSAGSHQMTGMDHSGHQMHAPEKVELKPLTIKAKLVVTPALDDNDVVARILRDRIAELSTNPANETVILVAHGPNGEEDNQKWVATLESLSEKIQKIQDARGPGFKQIFGVTVRDDAKKDIFNQAKENLRSIVRQSSHFGNVIVVPVFLSSGGRENAVAERLEGLNYKWNGKALLPDSRLSDFLTNTVNQALTGGTASE